MRSKMRILDLTFLRRLVNEFRRSMKRLLFELCDELEGQHAAATARDHLPIGYFRLVGRSLGLDDFSNWKIVGWIEGLNDLVYFLDVAKQLAHERTGSASETFASAWLQECEQQFYEHHYLEELFPGEVIRARGLRTRLRRLCSRIGRDVTQESLFLLPGLPNAWVGHAMRTAWGVPVDLSQDFERAEQTGNLSVGLDGGYLEPSPALRRQLAKGNGRARVVFGPEATDLVIRTGRFGVPLEHGNPCGSWSYRPPRWIRPPGWHAGQGLTVGPTLTYGKDRQPSRVVPTPAHVMTRLQRGIAALEESWPVGASMIALLTTRIVPLRAPGVVSFSYRHRPGLSFMNTFDRDALDLIDDLVHENSHHHLNLLLRKYRMLRGQNHAELFYSPWRRSLRPVRGILHATFTFTMGALLFARLSCMRGGERGRGSLGQAGTKPKTYDRTRARFRGLEEIASVKYSIRDLREAADHLHWLSPSGVTLVKSLHRHLRRAEGSLARFERDITRSRFGPALRRHLRELRDARRTYGLVKNRKQFLNP